MFKSKAALLVSAINDRVEGREQRPQKDDHDKVRQASTAQEMIRQFAESSAGVAERALPVVKLAYEAAAMDGEVAKQIEINEEHRYQAQAFFVDELQRKGFLRTDMPVDDLKRGFWLLASPQTLLTAAASGWDVAQYVAWLTQTVSGLLLPEDMRAGA